MPPPKVGGILPFVKIPIPPHKKTSKYLTIILNNDNIKINKEGNMKKFTKALALVGVLVCSSIGLVACNNAEEDLVNIHSNSYKQTTAEATSSYLAELDTATLEENQTFKVRMKMETTLGDETSGAQININAVGHLDKDGNFDFDAKVDIAESVQQMQIGISLYNEFDSSKDSSTLYMYSYSNDLKAESRKYIEDIPLDESSLSLFQEFLPITEENLNPAGVKDLIESQLKSIGCEIAETDSYVKIKYSDNSGAGANDIYVVFNKNGEALEFAGIRYVIDFRATSALAYKGFVEFAPSTEKVDALNETEKSLYEEFTS